MPYVIPRLAASPPTLRHNITAREACALTSQQVLGGIADTVAQTLTAVRERAVRKPGGVSKDDFFAIEIHELDKKTPYPDDELIPDSRRLPPPFDFERLTRFMAYGFLMAPVQHKWFGFLSRNFPITKDAKLGPAMKRVALDQFIFAPFGMFRSSGCIRKVSEANITP